MLLKDNSSAFKTSLYGGRVFTHQQMRKSLRGFYWVFRKNRKEKRQDIDVKEMRSPHQETSGNKKRGNKPKSISSSYEW